MHLPVHDQVLLLELLKATEDELEALGHNTLALLVDLIEHAHAMRLACASLSIDEVGAVVTVEDMHD